MRINNALLAAISSLFVILPVSARDGDFVNVGILARVDYQRECLGGDAVKDNCGFKGKNVSLAVSGELGGHFSYDYRQRLYRGHSSESFFNATDFLYLTYRPDDHWSFSGGKQIVGIGGYEYDLAPIDVYFYSEYCSNIACYQMGVSAGYSFDGGKDMLRFQVSQSPFWEEGSDKYAYNLIWNGSHGRFDSIWSLNMIEYLPGKFINYLALGNRFALGRITVFADFMNRSLVDRMSFLRDFTVVGKVAYSFNDRLNVFGKASFDYNDLDEEGDWCVMPGTSMGRVGCGVEYFPLPDKRVRLHASFCHSFGDNGNPLGALLADQQIASVGLTWRMCLLSR